MCKTLQQDSQKVHIHGVTVLQTNSNICKTLKLQQGSYNFPDETLMQTSSEISEIFQENSGNQPHCTSEKDIPSNDNSMNVGTVTKSSAIAFYGICFSVLKPCRVSEWDERVTSSTCINMDQWLSKAHETKQDYMDFIDTHVHAYLPDVQTYSELHKLVRTSQKHNHSKTCRKYRLRRR